MPNKEISLAKRRGVDVGNLEPTPTFPEMRCLNPPQTNIRKEPLYYSVCERIPAHHGSPNIIIRQVLFDGTELFTIYTGNIPHEELQTLEKDGVEALISDHEWYGSRDDLMKRL